MIGDLIELEIGNTAVTGIIKYQDAADLNIEITEPYAGLNSSRHIPYFSRPFKNYITFDGIKEAQEILADIYKVCQHIEYNIPTVALYFPKFIGKAQYLASILDQLKKERKQFRKNSSGITKEQHSADKLNYKNKISLLELKILECWNHFYHKIFPDKIPFRSMNNLKEYIIHRVNTEGKKHLFLNANVFYGLNDGCNNLSAKEFGIVLQRVEKHKLGIYGIEAFNAEGLVEILTFESYKTFPQNSNWFYSAFEKLKHSSAEDLTFSATYYVPGNY